MFPCGRQVTLCIACTTMFTDFLQGRLHGAGRDQLQAPPSPPRLGVQPCVRHSARPSTASGHSSSSRQPDSSPGRPPSAHLAAAKTGKEGHHTQPAFVSPIESHLERAAALYGSPQRRYMGSEVGTHAGLWMRASWCFLVSPWATASGRASLPACSRTVRVCPALR